MIKESTLFEGIYSVDESLTLKKIINYESKEDTPMADKAKTDREKMLEIIKKKQTDGGNFNKKATARNDRTKMRKGPKIFK